MKTFKEHYKLPLKNTTYSHVFDAKSNMVMEIEDNDLRDKLVNLINGSFFGNLPIKTPVTYKPTVISDCESKEVIVIRGWGRLSKLINGEEVQDKIGNEIANLINLHNSDAIIPNYGDHNA